MKEITLSILFAITSLCAMAQDATPTITYYNKTAGTVDTLKEDETLSIEAPFDITMHANVVCPSNYTLSNVVWEAVRQTTSETTTELHRNEEESDFTLTQNGTYTFTLTANFVDIHNVEFTVEKSMSITIAESELTCPDGFSPNGDGINDYLNICCKSLVSIKGCIFNRWGQRLTTISQENLEYDSEKSSDEKKYYHVWDGMIGGRAVKDGVYFINIDAMGADGTHYKIKKAINVLKGFSEDTDGSSSSSSDN